MTQTSLDFDTSRGRDNQHSQAAHEKLKPKKTSDRYQVWRLIHLSGKQGLTLEQIASQMGKFPHQISGRISELRKQGAIFVKSEDGITREGNSCSIYVT